MLTLIVLGFLLEASGLGMAAQGLWRTWRANSEGCDFLAPWARKAVNWIRFSMLGQSRAEANSGLKATLRQKEAAFGATVFQEFREDMTVDERIEIVQGNALAALRTASAAHAAVGHEQRARRAETVRLDERIVGTEREVIAFTRGVVVDGIPRAVGGLVVAAGGLLLQTIASAVGVG